MPEKKRSITPSGGRNSSSKRAEKSSGSVTVEEQSTVPESVLDGEEGVKEEETLPPEPEKPPTPPLPDTMREEPILDALITVSYDGGLDDYNFYHGDGEIQYKGGHSYQGMFFHGSMHGIGTYCWNDGTVYTGEFFYNRIQGKGMYTWPDDSSYKGEVLNGLRHGEGVYKSAHLKTSYNGEWMKGKRCGKGIMVYNSAGDSYYEGEWMDNNKCGFGIRRYSSGNVYEGEWKNNLRHGQGTMYWYDQAQEYTGSWKDGVQHGQGEIIWYLQRITTSQYPIRNRYTGELCGGERHGYGTFYYANGSIYEGEWSKNKKHGEGKFIFKNGSVYKGQFSDDHMVDFPDLILSGMTTPDIASAGLPIKSGTASTRAQSSLGSAGVGCQSVLENTNDTMLDINVDDLYQEYQLDIEKQEEETEELSRLILASISRLKKMYKFYSGLGVDASVDNTFVMTLLQFWSLLKDYKVHQHGCSLVEMDRVIVLDKPEVEMHSGTRSMFMRDFLNNLIRIADLIHNKKYHDYNEEPREKSISYALKVLLNNLPTNPDPQSFLFKNEEERVNEALKYYEEVTEIYKHFSYPSNESSRDSRMTMRDVLLMMSSLGLTNDRLTSSMMARILTNEHPAENGHDYDVEITPLEFFEFMIEAARVFTSEPAVKEEEPALPLEAAVGVDAALMDVGTDGRLSGETRVERLLSAGGSDKPSTAAGGRSSEADEKVNSKQSKKNVTSKESSKKPDASKSKDKKDKDDKLEKTHSKDKVHADGEEKKTKGKSPGERKQKKHDKPSELDVLHGSDAVLKRGVSNVESIPMSGDEIVDCGEITVIPPDTTADEPISEKQSDLSDDVTVPAEPVEDFSTWSNKLESFIRGCLRPAYVRRRELDSGVGKKKIELLNRSSLLVDNVTAKMNYLQV